MGGMATRPPYQVATYPSPGRHSFEKIKTAMLNIPAFAAFVKAFCD